MKIIAYTRAEIGSGASRRLRAAGMAPGIVMVVTANLSTSNWITMPFSTH